MNAAGMIKAGRRPSRIERMLGARGARLALVAGGTIAVTLSAPPALVDQLMAATGLGTALPFLGAPIGLGGRVALGAALALLPAALVWVLWAPRQQGGVAQAQVDFQMFEDEDEMMHARNLAPRSGWGAILRMVRGDYQDDAAVRDELLARRRRDRHPDAPPRPPLFASRDLPSPQEPSEASALEASARIDTPQPSVQPQARPAATISSISDAVARAQPRRAEVPLPRAPEPMSESELARAVAAIPPRDPAAPPRPCAADLLRGLDLPLIPGADIVDLASRFETGLAKRTVVADAHDARESLVASLTLATPDPAVRAALRAQRPVEVAPRPAPALAEGLEDHAADPLLRVDADVETALNDALATLRKLTAQARR